MINMADEAQLKELMQYISANIHFPVLGFGGGADVLIGDPMYHDVAIGTVIPGWLYADGSVYNIADYPQLAAHYVSHHGAANFYGGNGTTTFAVPDLRGEFLRGCGTNGHANQGNGAAVGVHQDATVIPSILRESNAASVSIMCNDGQQISNVNPDLSIKVGSGNPQWAKISSTAATPGSDKDSYTSRPTNTSYPIYIKATLGHTYSTTEQVVGTWIDGKTIYEKMIIDTMPSTAGQIKYVNIGASVDMVMSDKAFIIQNDNQFQMLPCFNNASMSETATGFYGAKAFFTNNANANANKIGLVTNGFLSSPVYINLLYTKA